ncbi:unnamed protein product [Prunus armeniaca]
MKYLYYPFSITLVFLINFGRSLSRLSPFAKTRPAILVLRPWRAVRAVEKGWARADDQVWAKAQPHQPLTTLLRAQKGLWISSFLMSFPATPAVVSVNRVCLVCSFQTLFGVVGMLVASVFYNNVNMRTSSKTI